MINTIVVIKAPLNELKSFFIKLIFISIISLYNIGYSHSNDLDLKGQVLSKNNKAFQNVEVSIIHSNEKTRTDSLGYFSIKLRGDQIIQFDFKDSTQKYIRIASLYSDDETLLEYSFIVDKKLSQENKTLKPSYEKVKLKQSFNGDHNLTFIAYNNKEIKATALKYINDFKSKDAELIIMISGMQSNEDTLLVDNYDFSMFKEILIVETKPQRYLLILTRK